MLTALDTEMYAMSEEEAAASIQATIRGRNARAEMTQRRAVADEPSEPFTADVARVCAAASGVGATPDGARVACARLVATGRRLAAASLTAALGSLPYLTSVDLSDNHLTTLDGLDGLPSLHSLTCCRNRLVCALDFAAPATGSRLRTADLRENLISGAVSLPADASGRPLGVDAHPRLETLLLDGNRLRSLRGVGAATRLRTFSVARNALQDTAGLEQLTELRALDLSANKLCQCDELRHLTSLRTLQLEGNRIAALPDLAGCLGLHTLSLASNALASLKALAEAITGSTLKASMDTDGDGFIDSIELATWMATEGATKNRSLRTLSLRPNPLLDGLPDARLRVLHALPTLASLDGEASTPEEVVAARGLHGDDATQLRAIRARFFPDLGNTPPNTVASADLPGLLRLYREQHTAAWQAGQQQPDE